MAASTGGSTSTQATATTYSYDAMGRVLREWEQTPSVSPGGQAIYSTYDLAGNLSSTTTAAGTVISYGHDGASRLTTVTSSLSDAQHPATLYSVDASLGYYPPGEIRKAAFGNNLTETSSFNNRLQPCRVNVNSTAAYFSNCTSATPSGNVLDFTMGYNAGTNNGNVASWSAVGNQTFTRSYTYDSLNRISTMADSASGQACKGLAWTIDAWGNMTGQSQTGTCYTFSSTAGTNNQLSGYTYDAAGNVTYDGTHHYTYDAENRIVQVDSGTTASYVYNENGKRARKNIGTPFTEFSYGPNGSVQSEYNGSSFPVQYVYAGSQLIAEYTTSTTEFVHGDHLGSTRLVTAMNQSIVDNLDYEPFGQTSSSTITHKFTGKERDNESGLDNFGARYNASSMGRFMTPDSPSYSNHKNPQSWNLYAYALNNPVTFRDADGHKIDCANHTSQCQADAAAATGNAQAAARVTTQTTTTQHSFLGIHWTMSETQIAIKGDVNSFRALSPNASKLADLVTSKDTITVSYDQYAKPSVWANGTALNGGSTSFTPSQGYGAQAFIDPTRTPGTVYDTDAVAQSIPQANTGEEFGHEVLGHIWGEMFGGALAGTRANMRDSIAGEDAVRALDPARGQKGLESHHNYNEMPPDPPKQ
jgi:RHS repeat-associated protein